MNPVNILKSVVDASVNFTQRFGRHSGAIEARLVHKPTRNIPVVSPTIAKPEYIACYVSSHSGCKMKCKMCYLTQNGNTSFDHVDIPTYTKQITTVLDFYQKNRVPTASRCNINFMARGEPLANKFVINQYPQLYDAMTETCAKYGLTMKPNISSIFPDTIRNYDLSNVFKDKPAYLYYSLYSLNEDFRRKWLPRALPYEMALRKLKDYQLQSGHILTFHWSVIKGENDSLDEAKRMADMLAKWDFNAKFQIVRFNKHPKLNYEEADTDRINQIFEIVNGGLGNHEKSYIVPRVGRDVYASCGTFVEDQDIQAGPLNL